MAMPVGVSVHIQAKKRRRERDENKSTTKNKFNVLNQWSILVFGPDEALDELRVLLGNSQVVCRPSDVRDGACVIGQGDFEGRVSSVLAHCHFEVGQVGVDADGE